MPSIIIKQDGKEKSVVFDHDLRIGRSKDNDLTLDSLSVSRNHARIRFEEGHFYLTDLESANGTKVNGVKITKTEIMHGDLIIIGKNHLEFSNEQIDKPKAQPEQSDFDRTMFMDASAPVSFLMVMKGKKSRKIKLTQVETTIGRAASNTVQLKDILASKRHALIVRQGAEFFLRDLGSWRGTGLNDRVIRSSDGPQPLSDKGCRSDA